MCILFGFLGVNSNFLFIGCNEYMNPLAGCQCQTGRILILLTAKWEGQATDVINLCKLNLRVVGKYVFCRRSMLHNMCMFLKWALYTR